MVVEERAFTIEEARDSDEAFFTSASAFVMPVVEIDGCPLVVESQDLSPRA
jgi:D-alanine transaminase